MAKGETMRRKHLASVASVAACLIWTTGSVALGDIEMFPVVRAVRHQMNPAVDDHIVAWQDNRHGDWDIGVADISNLSGFTPMVYADSFSEAEYPAVSGNRVVWQSKYFMYDDYDIQGLDLSKEAFFEVMVSPMDERRPAISGNLVVADARMTEHADWDIIGVDLGRPGEPKPFGVDMSDGHQQHVDISGSIVVYEDTFGGPPAVSGRDLSNLEDISWFPVFGGGDKQRHPAISGRWAVWQDEFEGTVMLAGDDLFHPRLPGLLDPNGTSDHQHADVDNNVVVWQDQRNGNWDIYGCNLTNGAIFQITDHGADQTHPAISFSPSLKGYVVVWQDDRNGTWDIYGAVIDGPEVAGCASPSRWDVNADGVVDASDLDAVEGNLGRRNGVPIEEN